MLDIHDPAITAALDRIAAEIAPTLRPGQTALDDDQRRAIAHRVATDLGPVIDAHIVASAASLPSRLERRRAMARRGDTRKVILYEMAGAVRQMVTDAISTVAERHAEVVGDFEGALADA
jgi:hypothetical protein